jgi:hypothetical protein
MPNLELTINIVFSGSNGTSDLYIRDYVDDSGNTTSSSVFASPGIIV